MADFKTFLKKKYPDADFDRYRYRIGDIIELSDGAKVLCVGSAIYYIEAYVIKRSIKYREYARYRISYQELPYATGDFVSCTYQITKKLKWSVGNVIEDNGNIIYLYQEIRYQEFYGWVIKAVNEYYLHTGIYIANPYKSYIVS